MCVLKCHICVCNKIHMCICIGVMWWKVNVCFEIQMCICKHKCVFLIGVCVYKKRQLTMSPSPSPSSSPSPSPSPSPHLISYTRPKHHTTPPTTRRLPYPLGGRGTWGGALTCGRGCVWTPERSGGRTWYGQV